MSWISGETDSSAARASLDRGLPAPERGGKLMKMGRHGGFGCVRIARSDRPENGGVRVEGYALLALGFEGHDALLLQPLGYRVVKGGEDRVARELRQHEVKGDVGFDEPVPVAD